MSKGMDYEEWQALRREMAVRAFVIDAGEMMITASEAEQTARARMARADAAVGGGQFHPAVQEWRSLERAMGNALIALDKLGYTVSPPENP